LTIFEVNHSVWTTAEKTYEESIGWTLGKSIQEHVDVYLTQETFREVQRSFPYLVSKEYASGGGDVRISYMKFVPA
jgi:hypothetical protein